MAGGPFTLLAEDCEDDVVIFRKTMTQALVDFPLFVVKDGQEAIDYLKGAGEFRDRSVYPVPDLLLLDLVMPRRNGFEVLAWIRDQPALSRLFVVVLTSVESIHNMENAHRLGAISFLVKPLNFTEMFLLSRFPSTARFFRPKQTATVASPISEIQRQMRKIPRYRREPARETS